LSRYKMQDEVKIKEQMGIAVTAVLQDVLKSPLHVKIHESVVFHDVLQPTGETFMIRLRVEVHRKKETTPEAEPKE
jgi:hypothetical protein